MGGVFAAEVEKFLARERYTPEQWRIYQTDRLRSLLIHTLRHVPYYRSAWSALGIGEGDVARFELHDLSRLPTITKEDIRRSPESFISEAADSKRLYTIHTSGSTGTPLAIRLTAETQQTQHASYEARRRRWAAVDHSMSRAMIGGRLVVPKGNSRP